MPFFPERGTFEELIGQLFREPDRLVYGNETGDQAYKRYAAAVDGILRRHSESNVVVVSHGTVMTLFMERRAGVEPVRFWQGLGLPDAVVLRVHPTGEFELTG